MTPSGPKAICRFAVQAERRPADDPDQDPGAQAGITTDGTYYVGITGFSEVPFDGNHFYEGAYSLTVSVTRLPEPGVMAQVAVGALGLLALATRRRAGA